MRRVVFGRLAYDDACEEAGHHGEAELPPVLETEEVENTEGGDAAEGGCEVGAHAHALQELSHAGAFLGAHGEDAEHGQHHADCGDEHGGEDGAHLHVVACSVECGCTQCHCGEDGTAVAFVKVCTHAGHVTHVVAHVVGDGGGVAGVVLGEVGLHLSDKVGAHIGGLGVDASAHSCEEGLGGCTHSEGKHGGGDDNHLLCGGDIIHEGIQEDEPESDVQKPEAYHGKAHDCTGAEGNLEACVQAAAGGVGGAAGGICSSAHADETGKSGEETAGEECEGHPGVLYSEAVSQHGEKYGQHGKHDDNYLVLLFEVSHCSLTHELCDFLHCRGSLILLFHLCIEDCGENERHDRGNGNCVE